MIDDHSRFPEIDNAAYGVLQVVKRDNDTPLNGHEFTQFARYLGFKHHKVTPLWSEANGEVERTYDSVYLHPFRFLLSFLWVDVIFSAKGLEKCNVYVTYCVRLRRHDGLVKVENVLKNVCWSLSLLRVFVTFVLNNSTLHLGTRILMIKAQDNFRCQRRIPREAFQGRQTLTEKGENVCDSDIHYIFRQSDMFSLCCFFIESDVVTGTAF